MKRYILTLLGTSLSRLASLMVSTATIGWQGEVLPPESLLRQKLAKDGLH